MLAVNIRERIQDLARPLFHGRLADRSLPLQHAVEALTLDQLHYHVLVLVVGKEIVRMRQIRMVERGQYFGFAPELDPRLINDLG